MAPHKVEPCTATHTTTAGNGPNEATAINGGLRADSSTTTVGRGVANTHSPFTTPVLLLNARGLMPLHQHKIPYLRDLVTCNQAICMALTETHLTADIADAEIQIPEYNLLRTDRKDRTHGGVAVYIREDVTPVVLLSHSNSVCDTLIVQFIQIKMVMCITYRPPDAPNHGDSFEESLVKMEEVLAGLNDSHHILLLGDFNFPHMEWPSGHLLPGMSLREQGQALSLLNFTNTLFMEQVVPCPTRGKNILDLCFTNNAALIHNIKVTPTILSDHNLIEVSIYGPRKAKDMQQTTKRTGHLSSLNFHKADWKGIEKEVLEQNWSAHLSAADIDTKLEQFMTSMKGICGRYAPERTPYQKRKIIPRDRKILMRRRAKISNRLSRSMKDGEESYLKQNLLMIESQLRHSHEKERAEKEARAVENIKIKPKAFYSFAKESASIRYKTGPLYEENGSLTADPQAISEILSSQYKSAFTSPIQQLRIDIPGEFFRTTLQHGDKANIDHIEIEEADVMSAIDEMRPNSATGPDGFPAILLKNCKKALAKPLKILFQSFLKCGRIPKKLKEGIVCPIHKGGSRAEAKNYRPVSLTSHISKVMERIVRRRLTTFLEENGLLSDTQHGFRSGRGCLTQLLQHYDWVLKHLMDRSNVDVIYLDFAKAFDKVDHGMICHKLRLLGINGKLGEWLHDFLKDRTQTVAVDGALSRGTLITSGVPQGTVLGPLLFVVALSDMPRAAKSATLTSYADDTKVAYAIKDQPDANLLQEDLDAIYKWAKENNMQFNAGKFQALRYRPSPACFIQQNYVGPEGMVIPELNVVRDLGIRMSSDATFHAHIEAVVARCKRMAGWILRTFRTRDQEAMLTLWRSFVLSHLDYCSQLWSPHSVGLIAELEAVQRCFTRRIESMEGLSYWERLKELRLYSLERRRDRYAVIYIWKILEGLVPNFGITSYNNPRTGRHCTVPKVPTASSKVRTIYSNSLGFKGPQLFNSLPKDLRNLHGVGVEVFKKRLDALLSTIPDEPTSRQETQKRVAASNSLLHQRPTAGGRPL